ncbi:MAG: nitroreductase family deazaflavin-dependent oxidoreductase [Actinomycetota bacterium]|nr:nitroreductase family deazaflavin-dependent oxidoreductase [Actinomycetota bacterium]
MTSERARNPFTGTALGGRVLSASQLPLFLIRAPRNYGVLTTTGRSTGKQRRRCVRIVRSEDTAYVVAIKGEHTGWLKNLRRDPDVQIRLRGGSFNGVARELTPRGEETEGREAYCEPVGWFEYLEYAMWRRGRPTPARIRDLHRAWFDEGAGVAVDVAGH